MDKKQVLAWMTPKNAFSNAHKLSALRLAATDLALAITDHIPSSPDRTVALRKVREALAAAEMALLSPMPSQR